MQQSFQQTKAVNYNLFAEHFEDITTETKIIRKVGDKYEQN